MERALVLFLAGIGSGLTGYGAGLASLVSFPALLAVGLPPVLANATNTAALLGITVGGVSSARPELRGTRRRVLVLGAAGLVGGALGAVLLVLAPASVFAVVVPWLVAGASLLLLLRPWLQGRSKGRSEGRPGVRPGVGRTEVTAVMVPVVVLLAVYGGYFGAAAGTMVVAVLGLFLDDSLVRLTALRAVILGLANLAATVVFLYQGLVDWGAALPLALGMLVGASVAPAVLRRLPEDLVRVVVALAGLGLAVYLALTVSR